MSQRQQNQGEQPSFTPHIGVQGLCLLDRAQRPVLTHIHASVAWRGGRVQLIPTGTPSARQGVRYTKTWQDGLSAHWWLWSKGPCLLVWATLENRGASATTIDEMTLLHGIYAQAEHPERIRQSGYQSWSAATPLMDFQQRLPNPDNPIMVAPGTSDATPGLVQPDYVEIHTATHHHFYGYISAHGTTGLLSLQPDWNHSMTICARCPLDGVVIRPGQRLRLDTLCLIDGQATDALARYTDLSRRVMRARESHLRFRGWCSWYHYFENVQAADVVENLDELTHPAHGWKPDVVLLDDGYQSAVGDWLSINPRFDGHPAELARHIRKRGCVPGIWLAPFCVSAQSLLAQNHPDWLVRDRAQNPVNHFTHWGRQPTYALDCTHPEAMAHLCHAIRVITQQWGYQYLKLDFLYAGAIHGQRHDPAITPVQAYRHGLVQIGKAAGASVTLAGSGAPMLASVGLLDIMRTGSDTAHHWHSKPPSICEPGALNAMRGVMARNWMNGAYWINDPDCALVGNITSELNEGEMQSMLTVIALCGGNVFLGDRVATLPSSRKRWLRRIFAPQARSATPLGDTHQGLPNRLYLPLTETDDIIAVFNWTENVCEWQYQTTQWPNASRFNHTHHLIDLWPFRAHPIYPQHPPPAMTIPPHGVCLMSRHAPTQTPRLLATDHTLLGGYPLQYATQTNSNSLTITTSLPLPDAGHAIISLPFNDNPPATHTSNTLTINWPANSPTLTVNLF